MKRDGAFLWGWAAGLVAAATFLIAALAVRSGGRPAPFVWLEMILLGVVLAAGPGLLLLSGLLSVRLRRRHAKGASRGSTLGLGALLGAALGVPAVFLVPLLFFGTAVVETLSNPRDAEALFMLALGVGSGAAGGLTCAWRVTRPRE